MDSLEECGITYLTASSIAAFRDNPAWWCLKYLYGKSGDKTGRVALSIAIREGVKTWLQTGDEGLGEDATLDSFMMNVRDWNLLPNNNITKASDELKSSYDATLPTFGMAVKTLSEHDFDRNTSNFIGSNMPKSVWLDGIGTPFLSSPSLIFEHAVVELKTTKACPSSIRDRELSLLGLHARAWNRDVAVLYVTMKKAALYRPLPAMLDASLLFLGIDAMAIEVFLKTASSREHALAMSALNPQHYLWSDKSLAEAQLLLTLSKGKFHGFFPPQTNEFRTAPSRDASGHLLPHPGSWDAGDDL